MADTKDNKWKELRKPFPKEVVGKLPKGGIHLDYVGHAAVTDRLLEVDPTWTWEPLGTRENGLPAVDDAGNLWIKLTVNGVTRIGVGDGKNAKECISDAIRNAAMRFGVALDLWSKEELESTLSDPSMKNEKPSAAKPAVGSAPAPAAKPAEPLASEFQKRQIKAYLTGLRVPDAEMAQFLEDEFGVIPGAAMTAADAKNIIAELRHAREGGDKEAA